ncbi:fatty acid synthase [Fopius arisanus]|uniref:Fatty acid synthase n=3 Tax=Fopius arisanus TaxID=64838 RepID=A0A9R1U370_9HYME|nr:PREDICTED: fatty acid synthase-like [Fopius arisanus]XP_011305443.1 PREDICTED: fatty acid synthase-like [Fopius arisanus]
MGSTEFFPYDPYRKVPLEPGEEIVISGISGRFPESINLKEFRENLMNKVDLITNDDRRWKLDHPEIPARLGKISNLSKFDADYFGINFKEAHTMDPMGRMAMEHAYEAIVDAGVNPKHLKGTKTGVFIGACFSESEMTWVYEKLHADVHGVGIIGCCRALLSNRISYWLDVHGPSYNVDSACSSSLACMEHAYRAIRTGMCDAAIVGGTNLVLHPNVSLQFGRLGVLSHDGKSKSFDNRANGYVRSETICTVLLQKAKNAKRIYGTVVHAKTNCDGFKPQGITFPSSEIQSVLLKDFYEECKIPASTVTYVEAHGTGTKVGDPEELNAIESVFCLGKKEPLKIGSVKSNMGHAEAASGMGQVAKVVIALETGIIPPNLHYKEPREGVEGLLNGKMEVVTEPTPWKGGYVGVSSFGFGGSNAHVLLKSNPRNKINEGKPADDLPRLVVSSGRTEEAVESILTDIESRSVDVEYVRLLHDLHAENLAGHLYRGYTILGTSSSGQKLRDLKYCPDVRRPVWFLFSGMGSHWPAMGTSLLRFPVFADAIKKCDSVLKIRGVDIYEILTNTNKSVFESLSNCFVGVVAMQIGLFDLLTSLKIVPDAIIGYSIGELVCAYADGCFTAEQTILAAYSEALALMECNRIKGAMAAVGLSYEQTQKLCPPDIQVACHNGPDMTAISGPMASINSLIAKLSANNIFAEEIPCGDIAYHSKYIADVGSKLFGYLKKIIPDPKSRSSRWHSTSIPQSQWNSPQAKFSSAEYHTNNLLAPVLFQETTALIPRNAIVIEIAPHEQLQKILKRSLSSSITNISLSENGHRDRTEVFLQAVGELYEAGLQPEIWKLYPEVKFPVSRGTPMLSPLIKWDHSEDWFVTSYRTLEKIDSGERVVELAMTDEDYEYMEGHVIDGKNLLPATGYLLFVWETVGLMRGARYTEVPIVFEDVRFLRATTLFKDVTYKLTIMINKGTGKFEVVEGGVAVVTGTVRYTLDPQEEQINVLIKNHDEPEQMTSRDIYKEFRLRGYQYSGLFKAIKSATTDGSKGTIAWTNNWVAFMDNMLQMVLLGRDTRNLFVPTGIRKLVINTKKHYQEIREMPQDKQELKVYTNQHHDVIFSGGVQIHNLQASAIARRRPAGDPVLETYKFVAHRDRADVPLKDAVQLATHLALENHLGVNVRTLEALRAEETHPVEELLSFHISETLANLPMIQAEVNMVTEQNELQPKDIPENVIVTEYKRLTPEMNALILAGRNILVTQKDDPVKQLLTNLKDRAFVITLESSPPQEIIQSSRKYGLQILLEKVVGGVTFWLFRKVDKIPQNITIITVTNEQFFWVNTLKTALKSKTERNTSGSSRILLVSDRSFENGLLGMINCLRKEPGGEIVRGLLIQDPNAPNFQLSDPLYADQMKLDLAVNVLRSRGTWGSYRHLPLSPPAVRPTYHAWANQLVKSDLSSFCWVEGTITPDQKQSDLVRVVYSSINFKDIMLATGKLTSDIFVKMRSAAECLLGFEYSGIKTNGTRVMGIIARRAITNILNSDPIFTWKIPDAWTLEEAATVPCVYATCIYALYFRGNMKKGDKVLIHAGSGGVGQAAINLALWTGCEIFTTVGTKEKRLFIQQEFPQIPDDHIGNSRCTTFEQMVMDKTNGKGVDIVLNSLADEKLQASVRCLAEGGRFLEIGKFDMANNSPLGMSIFLKEISFYGVLLDKLFDAPDHKKKEVEVLMAKALNEGAVKPINMTIFPRDQIEAAFRYMAAGKHIGKVLLQIQDEKKLGLPIPAIPRYYCREDRSYIILGGLGGFGLELADWLVLRGAQHLILTSRSGIKNGYQLMRIKIWQSYGVKVTIISGKEASDVGDCEEILLTASNQVPVDAIFNLAVVLKDNLFENQTAETFEESFKAKAWSTKNLDKLSRRLCPKLRHFVVFSSVSCGRGNVGQTNYGMSNSVMERVCERRAADGLPALAIQWGAVGDVGLVADMQNDDKELVIGGTLQQRITSCLHELDGFLTQNSPIVGSMVVAEKRAGGSSALNVVDTILNIMGLKDLKSISQHTSLAELGMDSMMAVEIKQTLEREFEIFLTAQDIRALNFSKLNEMISIDPHTIDKDSKSAEEKTPSIMKLLVKLLGADESMMQKKTFKLPTKQERTKDEIFCIPGIEGFGAVFMNIAPEIEAPAICLQLDPISDSIKDLATKLLPHVLEKNKNRKDFLIVGYSFGSLVALEMVRQLEALSCNCQLILIDGSPDFLKTIKNQQLKAENDEDLGTNLLINITNVVAPGVSDNLYSELQKCRTWEDKLEAYMERMPSDALKLSAENQRNVTMAMYQRLKSVGYYDPYSFPPIKSSITLLKPTLESFKYLSPDYGLTKLTTGKVTVHKLEGNHTTIMDNPKVAAVINGELLQNAMP